LLLEDEDTEVVLSGDLSEEDTEVVLSGDLSEEDTEVVLSGDLSGVEAVEFILSILSVQSEFIPISALVIMLVIQSVV